MDIFKFTNPSDPALMEQGVIIGNLKSKMWVERYAEAGEFKFVADVSTNMRNTLPIGSFVSHIDTGEIMIVENHEITDNANEESEITITGRGFETFLENRIVGSNKASFPTSGDSDYYLLDPNQLYNQIVGLIRYHIDADYLYDDGNALPHVVVNASSPPPPDGEEVARAIKRGSLYAAVLELLGLQKFGIKIVRPSFVTAFDPYDPNLQILIHAGQDRSDSILLSSDTGEIVNADYLWTNKNLKNAALVIGRWVEKMVPGSETGYNRRMMIVDASDIDNHFSEAPTGTDLTDVGNALEQRGLEALANKNNVALTRAEVSRNATTLQYRKDFELGDIISVIGDYNESSKMRISEFVEIEDETGSSRYPTLSLP